MALKLQVKINKLRFTDVTENIADSCIHQNDCLTVMRYKSKFINWINLTFFDSFK